jgi:hypothetical protein
MTTGMLWFDDSNKPLAEKVATAAGYYLKKYGQAPETCMVHPSMQDGVHEVKGSSGSTITVRPMGSILPGHLWLGVEDQEDK